MRVDSVTYAAEIHAPANGNEAQFSVAFAVAAALVNGDASIFQYTDAKVADPRIREMMAKIHVEVDKELDKGYPDKRSSVGGNNVLTDGQRSMDTSIMPRVSRNIRSAPRRSSRNS